jgi:hypothetical protein
MADIRVVLSLICSSGQGGSTAFYLQLLVTELPR